MENVHALHPYFLLAVFFFAALFPGTLLPPTVDQWSNVNPMTAVSLLLGVKKLHRVPVPGLI